MIIIYFNPITGKVVPKVVKTVENLNKFSGKIVNIPEKTSATFDKISKVTGATTGSMGAAKGGVDFLEAIACQDKLCATVSAIGVCADGLQIAASFIPGPNVTAVVTMPVSYGCKVFVWCCKRAKLPWRGC